MKFAPISDDGYLGVADHQHLATVFLASLLFKSKDVYFRDLYP
ncbi:predicted protein [Plenodomus lingam JN3]|uniref:Predicted protein n=1 Tax=Leptosphaeria maculans (strain JN3 / isolate v23.1.3 / race Av1-4-5-6-7-8) TaxID=985895 RepID=E4ZQ17_LEPMJ|nr:predicted protein [Plenodomus lingam JN3]CBX93552.1 predicted protein [Plenodomus lingam JN3]